MKVFLKSGEERWILVHIEVQARTNKDFAKRMFRYFYRIYDRFEREVYAIAIITDDVESVHPDYFHYSFYGTRIEYYIMFLSFMYKI